MPKSVKIYTRGGDDGSTHLSSGERVSKVCARVAAYGAVDELNSHVGAALSTGLAGELIELLGRIQQELFCIGAMLSNPKPAGAKQPRIDASRVTELETAIDRLDEDLEPLKHFIFPGGHPAAAQLHVARTVCRRAERLTIELANQAPIDQHIVPYLNRLSDLLFVAARYQNKLSGVADLIWKGKFQT